MKLIKFFAYSVLAALVIPFSGCEAPSPILDPDTAIHGLGAFGSGSPTNFSVGDLSTPIKVDLQWVSIDSKNTVTKIDLFVTMTEKYIDLEKNPRTANFGQKKIGEVTSVPGNRTPSSINITPQQILDAFKSSTFDYKDGKGAVSVFNASPKAERTASTPFITDDSFQLRWAFTTADGRYFDSWSDSVCLEFPGANCSLTWGVK